jgi:nucleoside-diphosphate-sugar epimerase
MAKEVKNNKYLTVWGKGDRRMQYIYIEDVIKFIIRSPNLSPGIYNLGANDYSSVLDTANQIAKYFGGKVKKLSDKKEGFTLPFMKNDKIVTASNMKFSANQQVTLKAYLSQLSNSL